MFKAGESSLLGQEIINEDIEKVRIIRYRLKIDYSRQKSYSDNRRRDLEFEIGDHVYFKVSPMKGVMIFGNKGK